MPQAVPCHWMRWLTLALGRPQEVDGMVYDGNKGVRPEPCCDLLHEEQMVLEVSEWPR